MVKIKTKKQLSLPQLIEYAWENRVKEETFFVSDNGMKNVHFNTLGSAEFSDVHQFSSDDYFTVEVEEEIREDTILDKLVVRYRDDDIYIFPQERINDFKNDSSIVAFYIPNDDFTLTLIWRDGKLIE